jgi:hypothetical protein
MKFKVVIKVLIHLLLIISLIILSQIGEIIYVVSFLVVSNKRSKYRLKTIFFFLTVYVTSTFLTVPNIAPFFGRVKIEDSNRIKAHSFITLLFNRNYVTPKMQSILNDIFKKISKDLPGIKLIYLDANFPFFD